ncbi:MAG: saccharopine dehydrogenase NADP-binding domain-containing protein [Actinomycetota bacterium]|nr:saccharopine dehydrogenase NADP-binding domain-containing protein [Actinomycetota bacterium]
MGATGAVGRHTAAELLRQPEVDELTLSGRDERAVSRLASAFGRASGRVGSHVVDLSVGRVADLPEADVIVSCAGPAYETEEQAVRGALRAGVPYVSVCDEHAALKKVRTLQEEARASGATIVSGCGVSPGITNMLIAHASRELDETQAIDIALARSSAESTGEASARHLLYELGHEAAEIQDHRPRAERSGTAPKLVYFPEPVGWVETFRSGHPEVITMPERHGSLESLQFRVGLIERITMDAARAFAATPLIRREGARRAFVKITRPVRPLIDRLPPSGPPWTAIRIDVRGSKNGSPETISLGAVDRLVNLASVPLTLAAMRLALGEAKGPGVKAPEEAFEVGPFLRDLVRRGIGVARLEPRPL